MVGTVHALHHEAPRLAAPCETLRTIEQDAYASAPHIAYLDASSTRP
jgi:hypothetical protein